MAEHLARVGIEALAFLGVHLEEDLRGRTRKPGDTGQRAGHGKADAVGIAGAFSKPCGVDVAAPDVERIDRARHRHALGQHVDGALARDPFATGHAVHVNDEGFEYFNIGICREEFASLFGHVHGSPCG